MGYVFDYKDAVAYDNWTNEPRNRMLLRLQEELMMDMLAPKPHETLLDVGMGTGVSLMPFIEKRLNVTGIEPSPYMVDIARASLGHRAEIHQGFSEDLPFEDNAFNYVTIISTLEFVDDPEKTLREAMRVAKNKLFIGIMNRYSFFSLKKRIHGLFSDSVYNRATFFSVWTLKQMVRRILNEVPVKVRTVSRIPMISGMAYSGIISEITHSFEKSGLVRMFPFGSFAGILVTLVPYYTTRPLIIRCKPEKPRGLITGIPLNPNSSAESEKGVNPRGPGKTQEIPFSRKSSAAPLRNAPV